MAREIADVYEWMLLNVERLADAVIADGKMGGTLSAPLLDDAFRYERAGKLVTKAKNLLKLTLRRRGHPNLV